MLKSWKLTALTFGVLSPLRETSVYLCCLCGAELVLGNLNAFHLVQLCAVAVL